MGMVPPMCAATATIVNAAAVADPVTKIKGIHSRNYLVRVNIINAMTSLRFEPGWLDGS